MKLYTTFGCILNRLGAFWPKIKIYALWIKFLAMLVRLKIIGLSVGQGWVLEIISKKITIGDYLKTINLSPSCAYIINTLLSATLCKVARHFLKIRFFKKDVFFCGFFTIFSTKNLPIKSRHTFFLKVYPFSRIFVWKTNRLSS